MHRLAARQRLIITATLVAAGCIGTAVVFALASKNARSGRAALGEIEASIRLLEQKHSSDIKTSQTFARRTRDVERVRKFFVEPERPLDFIEKIEDLARRTGNGISLTLDQSRTDPKTLFLRLDLEGSDPSVAAMLSLIDTLPYDIKIERMNYETLREREGRTPIPQNAKASARVIIVLGVKTR